MSRPARRESIVVALSGVDSSGKSTQRELLLEHLRAMGYAPVTIWSRAGYTPGLKAVRRGLRALTGRRKPPRTGVSGTPSRYPRRASNLGHPIRRKLWLTTALLDLLWLYCIRLRLWRARGRAVVCDRYLLDCLVDFRVNFPDDHVERRVLGRWLRRFSVEPDVAFCILVPADESCRRSQEKSRFHWETAHDLERRYVQYRAVAQEMGVRSIDGCRPAAEIAETIRQAVDRVVEVEHEQARPVRELRS